MSKPLLLVDVDGVLCPFGWGPHNFDGGTVSETLASEIAEQHYPGYDYSEEHYVHTSQENAKRLQRLSERFELAWCTGWLERANEVISPLHGLPELPVVEIRHFSPRIHWKHSAIEKFVKDRPYAFIDDDITRSGLEYAAKRNLIIPTMWVPTSCHKGMTSAHEKRLENFADAVEKWKEEKAGL